MLSRHLNPISFSLYTTLSPELTDFPPLLIKQFGSCTDTYLCSQEKKKALNLHIRQRNMLKAVQFGLKNSV